MRYYPLNFGSRDELELELKVIEGRLPTGTGLTCPGTTTGSSIGSSMGISGKKCATFWNGKSIPTIGKSIPSPSIFPQLTTQSAPPPHVPTPH